MTRADQMLLRPTTPLSSLTAVVARMARASTTEQVVEIVRTTARALIGCEGITYVRKEGDFCHYVEEDAIAPLWKGSTFPSSACISGWSIVNGQTAVISDIALDARIPHELYEKTFVKALAMAPIRVEDPLGAIGAYWAQRYEPTAWELELLEALASAAGTAIENIERIDVLSSRVLHDQISRGDNTDVERVATIPSVPLILEVVLRITGMGFAAVARVTEDKWIACQVLDQVSFGLESGGELPLKSTICNEIRNHRKTVVINDVASDPFYCDHHTPRIYDLRSYISVPIVLSDGSFFGTLCAISRKPALVNDPHVIGSFELFAELIARSLDDGARLASFESSLRQEREFSEVREQFMAVLGHDLRNPIAAIDAGVTQLLRKGWTDRSPSMLEMMKSSVSRMSTLITDIMDMARIRLGEGLSANKLPGDLAATVEQVVAELRMANPTRIIVIENDLGGLVTADHSRIGQMISNLVANAIAHGSPVEPVIVAGHDDGNRIEIKVINTGKPIAPEQFESLFLPFRKGSVDGQGLGLGLYIASQIAKEHGGSLTAASDDRETRFTFTMPKI